MATVVIMEGDETGQELLVQALRVTQPSFHRTRCKFRPLYLSLENRRRTGNRVVFEAAEAMRHFGVGLKAATITPEGKHDVGSPNAILREEIDAQIILRTGRRIPGVRPVTGVVAPISVVRMAVDDAYGAKEWREGSGLDEIAYRTMRVRRSLCRVVAEFAFRYAKRTRAKVFGGPKFTVSPVYEGLLKEEMDTAAARHPEVPYDPQLIDAVYALLLQSTGEALVIPALNRDGDTLADMVLQMFGSIAGVESLVLHVDDQLQVRVVMAEAPHGTAPRLRGRNIANPMAMFLAAAAMLADVADPGARRAP